MLLRTLIVRNILQQLKEAGLAKQRVEPGETVDFSLKLKVEVPESVRTKRRKSRANEQRSRGVET